MFIFWTASPRLQIIISPFLINCLLYFKRMTLLGGIIKPGGGSLVHWKCHWHQSSKYKTQKIRLPHKLQKLLKILFIFILKKVDRIYSFFWSITEKKSLLVLTINQGNISFSRLAIRKGLRSDYSLEPLWN